MNMHKLEGEDTFNDRGKLERRALWKLRNLPGPL